MRRRAGAGPVWCGPRGLRLLLGLSVDPRVGGHREPALAAAGGVDTDWRAGPVTASRTDTRTIDIDADPTDVLALLAAARRLPEWACLR